MEISASRIMVTGATGGIGAAVVSSLAAHGAQPVVVGRRASELEALAERTGGDAVVADLTDASAVEQLGCVADGCDALVLNAGLAEGDPDDILAVNLLAPMRLAESFVRTRLATGRPGAVVFTGSIAGLVATPGMGAYNASKFGLRGYALSLANELAGSPVTATHLVVGYVRDAGMMVNAGARPPRGIRTRSPVQVADAVMDGVRSGPAERWVAPVELRAASLVVSVLPRVAGPVLRRVGSTAWRPPTPGR